MKIFWVAIARTLLLNLAMFLASLVPAAVSLVLSPFVLVLVVAYVNQLIEWKRQGSRTPPLELIKLQKPNVERGGDAFIILNLAVIVSMLGVFAYQFANGELRQPTELELGLAVIATEILIVVFYVFNELKRQKAAKNKKPASRPHKPLKPKK